MVCMQYWHAPPSLFMGVCVLCPALLWPCMALSSILRGSFLSSFMFITNACQSVSLFFLFFASFFFFCFFLPLLPLVLLCANKNISNIQKNAAHTRTIGNNTKALATLAPLATLATLARLAPAKHLQLQGGTGAATVLN